MLRQLQNSAARFVYRIPIISETQAIAYLVFVTNPDPGDTVSIGEDIYTWQAVLSSVAESGGGTGNGNPYDVLIGATPAASATNLLAAITTDNYQNTNAGVLYGSDTAENGDVMIYPPGAAPLDGLPGAALGVVNIGGDNYSYIEVGSVDFGTAYNLTPVAESTANARTTWLSDILALSHTTTTYAGGTNPSFDTTITAPSTWMEFLDQDTNVLKSQVADDQYRRFYFASPSTMPSYNTYDRIVAGQPNWLLGVPAPGCSPGVSVTGGGDTLQLGNLGAQDSGQINGLSNFVYLVQITPDGATQIQDVQIGSVDTSGAGAIANFAALIYQDNNGVPGELLNTGVVITGIAEGMNTSSFTNPSNLIPNTPYWIGFMTDTAIAWQPCLALPANMAEFANTFDNGPPGEAPAASTGNIGIQMFADLITSDVQEARAYVYTWVSQYDEEGPPSPATLLDGWSNGVWTVGMFTPPTDDMGVTRNLQYCNLYRTVTGTGGGTVYYYVATFRFSDWAFSLTGISGPWYSGTSGNLGLPTLTVNGIAVGGLSSTTAQFVDVLPDNYVTLNIQLPSVTWYPPPENLQGLINLPNGMMAGFLNNEIWFCQPYQPHAWPAGYVLTTDYPIVGIGVTAGALVACTNATPYVINGVSPGNMSQFRCSAPLPCAARGSILSGDSAVTYMSPNGLVQVIATGSAVNTTDLWFTREKWQQLTPQKYTRAIYLASCYFCYGTTSPLGVSPVDTSVAQDGFTIELDQDNTSFTIWPQPGGHRLGFNELSSHVLVNGIAQNIDNVLNDAYTGIGMLISDGAVYYYDFTNPAPTLVPYTWTSKIYQQNNKKSYSAMKVFFTVPAGTPAQNPYPNEAPPDDPSWTTLSPGQWAIIKTFVDLNNDGSMVLIDAREVRKSGGLLRLPSGFKAENWQWEIMGQVTIANVQIATSAKELANV